MHFEFAIADMVASLPRTRSGDGLVRWCPERCVGGAHGASPVRGDGRMARPPP